MEPHAARIWIFKASLFATAATFLFFVVSPAVGYPLRYDQSVRLLQIVLPVFLGYIGSATKYIVRTSTVDVKIAPSGISEFLGLSIKGPVFVYFFMTMGSVFAFGWTNRQAAPPGEGMSVDTLSLLLCAALSLLAAATSLLVQFLYSSTSRTGQ